MAVEILRRIVLATGVVAAAALICYSPEYLYAAKPVDWAEKLGSSLERERDSKRMMGNLLPGEDLKNVDLAPQAKKGLQPYIDSETKDRLYEPTTKEWTGVYAGLAGVRHGNPPNAEWKKRLGREWDNECYFSDQDKPFEELKGILKGEKRFTYVAVSEGSAKQHLSITKRMKQDSMRYAPGAMAFPYRRHGFIALIAAALLYWLIPWPKVKQESLRYSRSRAAAVPDITAGVMIGAFFSLPILITSSNAFGEGIFSPGWIYLTMAMWFFCLLFGSIWVFSANYTSSSLEWADGSLKLTTWRGKETLSPGDIETVGIRRIDPQKLNKWLLWISLFVNWRASGAILANSGPEYAICLVRRDGRIHRFPLKASIGATQIVGRLAQAGAVVEPEVYELLGLEPTSNELAAPFPALGKGIGAFVAAFVFVGLFAYLAVSAKTIQPLKIEARPLPSAPYREPVDTTWVPSAEIMQAEEKGLDEIKGIQKRMKELEQLEKTGTEEQRKAAVKESEELLQKANSIYEKIDQMRKDAGAKD